MCEQCDDTGDTGAFLAIRYKNLDSNWLKTILNEINERVGWLKQNASGNAVLQIDWKGGKPRPANWFVKIISKPKQ